MNKYSNHEVKHFTREAIKHILTAKRFLAQYGMQVEAELATELYNTLVSQYQGTYNEHPFDEY